MSLGTKNPNCKSQLPVTNARRNAIERAIDAGIHVVIAAGNDDCHVPIPMSHIEGVITVGSVNSDGDKAHDSNYGPTIDVVAPGVPVLSTVVDDSDPLSPEYIYSYYGGTSMAAPHVSGVLALMLSVNPNLTPEDVGRMIRSPQGRIICKLGPCPVPTPITTDLGQPGHDHTFGFGLIDAHKAVTVAQGTLGLPPKPRLTLTPDSLDFGDSRTFLITVVSNGGKRRGPIVIGQVTTDDRPWLTAIFHEGSPYIQPYVAVRVDRTGLSPGVYYGDVFISSNGGDRTVPVRVEVKNPGGNAGAVYVLVVEPIIWSPWHRS